MLAADPEAGQHQRFDLAPLRLRAGLSRAPFKCAHDAPFDHGFQSVHAKWGLGPHQADSLVPIGARGADELVVSRAKPLPIEVVGGSDPVKDHPAGRRPAVRGHRKNLVDTAAELCAGDHVGKHAAERLVELESCTRQPLTGGHRNRQRVNGELSGRRCDQADLHGR